MCSVVGCSLRRPGERDFALLRKVFLQSQIRGRHATGVAYLQDDQVRILKQPGPAEIFPWTPEQWLERDGSLTLIGHCRYSTSDLDYNQPIGDGELAIVHNGVITQADPSTWESTYGVKCETRNDSELLWHAIKEGSPYRWPDASVAVLSLGRLGGERPGLHAWRNGKRPLWGVLRDEDHWVVSTRDIAVRSGLLDYTGRLWLNKLVAVGEEDWQQ